LIGREAGCSMPRPMKNAHLRRCPWYRRILTGKILVKQKTFTEGK